MGTFNHALLAVLYMFLLGGCCCLTEHIKGEAEEIALQIENEKMLKMGAELETRKINYRPNNKGLYIAVFFSDEPSDVELLLDLGVPVGPATKIDYLRNTWLKDYKDELLVVYRSNDDISHTTYYRRFAYIPTTFVLVGEPEISFYLERRDNKVAIVP